MITDLRIENFRRFRRLDIDRLCPVNLLVGANGVGKTTVLEALEAFSQGHGCLTSLVRLLVERQEAARPPAAESQLEDPAQGIAGALAHLFNREAPDQCLRLEGGRTDRAAPAHLKIQLGWTTNIEEEGGRQQSFAFHGAQDALPSSLRAPERALSVTFDETSRFEPLSSLERSLGRDLGRVGRLFGVVRPREDRGVPVAPCVRVPAGEIPDLELERQWRVVVYENREEGVLGALKLIVPDAQKVFFIGTTPFVRHSDGVVEPLRSLGDGVVRLFQIAVALHAPGTERLLLLDEADRGLHYAVLPRFWDALFGLAGALGVQVVATTHSADCIRAFAEAARAHGEVEGQILRIDAIDQETLVTVYEERLVEVVQVGQVEVR